MAKKFTWKIWLRPNRLTTDVENDYIAEVSTAGNTQRNEDVARSIVEARSELRYDTILSILHERDAAVRSALLGGSSVQDGNVHLTPRVAGSWVGTKSVFDPAAHKITLDATLTAELRKALGEEVSVEVLGVQAEGGARINLVTDVYIGKPNGTIHPHSDIIIDGEKIKIAPDNEAGLGVFFVATDGTETPIEFPTSENTPKRILCRVPGALVVGQTYTLKIVTRFTSGGNLLKAPRAILYELTLEVV
ncbi:MAG: DUF4469 domain-containing protein [Prevotellaceae bacterium]|nr:DUF4469 domain-containing protein [Prevotellaceae bacterium]